MKYSFEFKGVHSCEAVVLSCIDFRFWKETLEYVEKELGIKTFDFPSVPGGAKVLNELSDDVNLAMECIGVPVKLHHVQKIVIVNHQDCGAYGGSANFENDDKAEQEFHEGELRKAKNTLLGLYPGKEIVLLYAKLTDNKSNIEFITIS